MNAPLLDLRRLVAPMSVDAFMREHWGRQPLLAASAAADRADTLFDFEAAQWVIGATHPAATDWLEIVQQDERLPLACIFDELGQVRLSRVMAAYARGYTMFLRHLDRRWPAVARVCEALDRTLRAEGVPLRWVNAQGFVTPVGAQGFRPHRDEPAVFVVQLGGSKHWEVYEPQGGAPDGELDPSALRPVLSTRLSAGDVLYLPERWPHAVRTTDEPSLHLTLRAFPITQAHVRAHQLASDVRFHRPLDADTDADAATAEDDLQHHRRTFVAARRALEAAYAGREYVVPGNGFAQLRGSDDDGEELVLNPTMRLSVAVEGQVRGRGRQRLEITSRGPDLRRLVELFVDDAEAPELTPAQARTLTDAGILLEAASVPTVPTTSLLVRGQAPVDADSWVHNPDVAPAHACPADAALWRTVADTVGFDDHCLFVRDPATQIRWPVRLPADVDAVWHELVTGTRSPADLTAQQRGDLAAARLLVRPCDAFATTLRRGHESLRDDKIAVIRALVPPALVTALRTYVDALRSGAWLADGDDFVERRHGTHNDPLMQVVHRALTSPIDQLMRPSFGPVKPSYSFLAVYERGAVLRRHTDREQCAWNLSVALGSEPHLPVDRQWPLHIETASGRHAVRLGPGDAVVYSGSDSPHWRDELQSIDSVTVAFCHFVDAAYEGPLC